MFFQAAKVGQNDWFNYVITIILCIVANLLASFPLVLYLINEGAGVMELSDNMAAVFSTIENKNILLLLLTLPFVATLLVFIFCIRKLHKRKLKSVVTGFQNFRWNQFFFAFLVCSALMIISTVGGYLLEPDLFVLQFNLQKFMILLVIALVFITIQACTEEILFRGYLTQGIGILTKSRFAALIIPTILFASLHLGNPEVAEHGVAKMFPLYFILGLSFAIMTLMSNGAELAMGYHTANNVMISLLVTSPEAVLQTDSIFRSTEVANVNQQYIAIIILEIVIISLFAWKYKWTDWKGKLFGKIT